MFKKAPVYFIGHGSPMNALQNNEFTRSLSAMRAQYPSPRAIVCVSAHWMTRGTGVTAMSHPKTIHDFYGFPQELFGVQYPAPGDPGLAREIAEELKDYFVFEDREWGLDHGTWSVLRHLFPQADIPVVQLSLDMEKPAEFHYELGKRLRFLRQSGVLIVGSGNVVHNLRRINWDRQAPPYDWAVKFDEWVKQKLTSRDFEALVRNAQESPEGQLSIPTLDHWFPFLYILGAAEAHDQLDFAYEGYEHGSISLRTLSFT